ncbi:MAG: hypothetical protein Fur0021_35180 [Candidatus Promineifilaceae bacterium]
MPDYPPVTIIVVNWNARAYLGDCLSSLLAQDYALFKVVLVDNASTDGAAEWVRWQFPAVEVIENEQNVGFAAGNNIALRRADTELVVLANPDITAPPDWLRQLISPMLADPTIGIAGCKVFYPDGRLQHAGGILRPPLATAAYRGAQQADTGQFEEMADVDYVIGAALAMRRSLGLLDEGYFLYYEEADLCARARRAGQRVVYVPQACLTHIESATTPKGDAVYLQRMHTSRWRYLLKHGDEAALLADTVPAEEAWLAQRHPVERLAAAWAYWETVRHLPAIWNDRVRDGAIPISQAGQQQLGEALCHLHAMAWAGDETVWKAMRQIVTLSEPRFRSNFPLLGALIARFRAGWGSVAVRWYLRPLLAQQSAFNELLANQLHSQQVRLQMQAEEQAALAQAIAELAAAVNAGTRRSKQ